jgi:hypothetical protein
VGVDFVKRASTIMRWYLHEAFLLLAHIETPIGSNNAQRASQWMVRYCRQHATSSIPLRDMMRTITPKVYRKKGALQPLLTLLEGVHHIAVVGSNILVNPALIHQESRP